MNKKGGIGILILVVVVVGLAIGGYFLFFGGDCEGGIECMTNEEILSLPEKEQVVAIHERNTYYFLNGMAGALVAQFPDYIFEEVGATREEYEKEWERAFDRDEFSKIEGKKVSEVFDLSKTTIWEKDQEIPAGDNVNYICCGAEGDYHVILYVKDEQSLDGILVEPIFSMVYKKVDGEWKIVRMAQ